MKNIFNLFFSMKFMTALLILFAFSCAVATFIENDFGTESAWALVYTAWWFELIQVLLGLNLAYNIVNFKLYKKEKIPALIFHASLLFILIGSGLTRYFGYEGTLHIREGESNNIVKSNEPFISLQAYKNGTIYGATYKKLISNLGSNDFSFSLDIAGESAKVKFKEYVPNAIKSIVDDPNGVPLVSLVISKDSDVKNIVLYEGETIQELDEVIFAFNTDVPNASKPVVRISLVEGEFSFISTTDTQWFKMSDNTGGSFKKDSKQAFDDKHLYTIGDLNFAAKYIGEKGMEKIVSEEVSPQMGNRHWDALLASLTYKGTTQDVILRGLGRGYTGQPFRTVIDNTMFALSWGSVEFQLPFEIKLEEFELERYPGSRSPSSYASEVIVRDGETQMPYRVYMNHVLDYKGFRFFQASYDEDEKGTTLAVNKDPGKIPTYLGYFLLSLGLLLNVLNPKSRFRKLASMINKDLVKTVSFALFTLFLASAPTALNAKDNGTKAHAELFATVLAQSMDGRIRPIDTIAYEVLNKVHRSDSYKGLNADEVIYAMIINPLEWQDEKIVRITHPELKKLIGVEGSYASFNDFFDQETFQYKLTKVADIASRKKEAEKNQFDKDVIKVDERLNILYSVFDMNAFRIVPKIDENDTKWYTINDALNSFDIEEASEVEMLFSTYFNSVWKASESGNWTNADKMVEVIKIYQNKYSPDIIPSESKMKAELFFNKAKIFDRIYIIYLLSGLVLLGFIFAKMLSPKLNIKLVVKVFFTINLLTFIVHTAGLALRWYVANHAPWSNSYESMIYIAWAIALAGLFFSRSSVISMSLTYILAGITLFSAHLSWMDPQITNLMPVLKSHWLTIHVSVITASYGFFGLCALLGFFTLILYIILGISKNAKYKTEVERNITESSRINEMAMILGLSLLTIGNFLGGVWANESWGRYWGWDPKETWALISILIYAAIAHFRFIPRLNTQFAFAVASVIAYFSILMTYFGVNFYLSGQHSYASGDPVPIPYGVYIAVAVITITIIAAAINCKEAKKL